MGAFYDYKLILKMKNSIKIQEIDLKECPDCKKPVQKPYFIEGCGHLLCKDCAYRLASKWDPCPVCFSKFSRRDLRPYNQQNLEEETTSQKIQKPKNDTEKDNEVLEKESNCSENLKVSKKLETYVTDVQDVPKSSLQDDLVNKKFTKREEEFRSLVNEKNEALKNCQKIRIEKEDIGEDLTKIIEQKKIEIDDLRTENEKLKENKNKEFFWSIQNFEQNCIPETIIPDCIKCSSCEELAVGAFIDRKQENSSFRICRYCVDSMESENKEKVFGQDLSNENLMPDENTREILASLNLTCEDPGCQAILPANDMKDHKLGYRKCPFCSEFFSGSSFDDHKIFCSKQWMTSDWETQESQNDKNWSDFDKKLAEMIVKNLRKTSVENPAPDQDEKSKFDAIFQENKLLTEISEKLRKQLTEKEQKFEDLNHKYNDLQQKFDHLQAE